MKTYVGFVFLFVLCPFASIAQVPLKKDDLTLADREEWRKILKWPDECEKGFREDQRYSPPSGIDFTRSGKKQYLVSVACGGSSSIFISYDESKPLSANFLKFKEYEEAFGKSGTAYSQIHFVAYAFYSSTKELWIYTQTADKKVCLMHQYRIRHGRPVFLKRKKLWCSDVI